MIFWVIGGTAGSYQYIRPPRLIVATSSCVGGAEWPSLQPGDAALFMHALSVIAKEDFALLHAARFHHMVHEKVGGHALSWIPHRIVYCSVQICSVQPSST
jgi:hypothetical protein